MELLLIYVLGVGFVVVLLSVVVAFFAFRSKERWLVEGKKVAVGAGAFRKGPTQAMPEVQQRRWLMVPVGLSNIVLAAMTTFFLAPAGALGSMLFLGSEQDHPWFWAAILVATIGAVPLSFLLIVASVQLARRSRTVVPFAIAAGLWCLLHHGMLVAVSALLMLVGDSKAEAMAGFTLLFAVPGLVPGFGNVLAGLLSVRGDETLDPETGERLEG